MCENPVSGVTVSKITCGVTRREFRMGARGSTGSRLGRFGVTLRSVGGGDGTAARNDSQNNGHD